MLGVTDFSKQQGRTHLGKTVAETKQESTSNKHYRIGQLASSRGSEMLLTAIAVCKCRETAPEDHEQTTNCDSGLSSPPIGNIWAKEQLYQLQDPVENSSYSRNEEADN